MEGDKEVVKKSSRRAHRKSRTGCSNCKARKVKCDEAKPQCAQCVRHSMHCSFMSAPNSTDDPAPLAFSKRFIPSRYQERVIGGLSSSRKASPQAESSPDTTTSSTTYQNFSQLPVADLELLYNFMTSTCHTFGDDTESRNFWEKKVMEIGFSYDFVLHLVLAFSALHLADSRPDRQAVYFAQAERHYCMALQAVTALLSRVNAQNCHALFVASILIAFYHFGKGPQPGDFLAFSEHGEPEWLVLLGGVRTITESASDVLHEDNLVHAAASRNGSTNSPSSKGEAQPAYKKPIQDLRQFIEDKMAAGDPNAKTSLEALESLSKNFAAVYGDTEYEDDGRSHMIFRWLYCASDSFSLCLQQKQPLALIIFAYFTSLMQIYESQWFIRPWISHIMTGIWRFLPAEYRPWIQWPIEQINWVSPIDSELSVEASKVNLI